MMPSAPILVVDDDRDLRETITAVLEHEGYHVRCAENGAQALSILQHSSPRAVVLDLSMPVMSGWELIDTVRHDEELAGVPMLVLSGMRAPAGVPQLPKPVKMDDLVTAVDRMCSR